MAIYQDNAPHLAGAVITLTTIAYLTYALRVYTRVTRKAWGPEDWLMTVALFPFTMLVIGCLGGSFNGIGIHNSTLQEPGNEKYQILGQKWFFIFDIGYLTSIIPIKLSISLMLIRLAGGQKKIYIHIQYVVIGMFLTMNVACLIFILINCSPIAANWDKTLLEKGGHCYPANYLADWYYATTAVGITTDWITALMPIPLLWDVQLNRNAKITTIGLLSLGVFASITACVRLKYTVGLTDQSDFLYALANILIWGFAENGVGMTVGNIATLRPLFRHWLNIKSVAESRGKYPIKPRSLRNPPRFWPSYELDEETLNTTDTHVHGGIPLQRSYSRLSYADSQREILQRSKGPGGNTSITISRAVNVSYE